MERLLSLPSMIRTLNMQWLIYKLVQVIVLLMVEQREIFLPFMMVRLRLEIVLEPMLQTQYPKAERL